MATFSVNQVRQLFVAKSYTDSEPTAEGAIKVGSNGDSVWFQHLGAGGPVRSDLIDKANLLSFKVTNASAMARALKTVTVTLDSKVNNGTPISGKDYILRIAFRQYVGITEEDQYFKYGMVHATSGMTASDFYKELAVSIAKNFSKELTPLINVTLTDHTTSAGEVTSGDVAVPVLENGKVKKLPSLAGGHEYTAVVISEVEQEWILGKKKLVPVYFTVQPVPVDTGSDTVIWGIVKDTKSVGTIKNGKDIADLEYFCMGERGDIYRGMGYPNNLITKYLVDPTKEYHTIDIHYAYVGANESVQKSEKDITIVSSDKTTINSIITKLNSAFGTSVKTL